LISESLIGQRIASKCIARGFNCHA
jgi:hypothetical protein